MRTEYRVNDMTIHRIVEQEQGFTPMLEFLPNLAKETLEENLSWLAPGGYNRDTGNVVLCYQSYVVKTPHHNILVDACIGNDKNFPLRPTWNKKNDSTWMNALKAAGLRVELDERFEKIGYKIREAQLQKIPYMLVTGDREAAESTVAVRSRLGGDLGAKALDAFIEDAIGEVKRKQG